MQSVFRYRVVALAALLFAPALPAQAVIFYYEPTSGMVAFDTVTSPSGRLTSYELGFLDSEYEFRSENHARISNSPFYTSSPQWVSDRTDARPLEGYYAIGEILQPGLTEDIWSTMFKRSGSDVFIVSEGVYYYSDLSGDQPLVRGEATFAYGLPDRPFDNATKLLDLESIRWAENAELRYEPETGELVLDTSGAGSGYISGFSIELASSAFAPEVFQPPVEDALLSYITPELLAILTDVIPPGTYSLGDIMEAGLSRQQFADMFLASGFSTRAQSEQGVFDITVTDAPLHLVFVPEPTAAMVLVLPAAFLAWRSRTTRIFCSVV